MNFEVDKAVKKLITELVKQPKEVRSFALLEAAAQIVECGADEAVGRCSPGTLTCMVLYAAELRGIASKILSPQDYENREHIIGEPITDQTK